MSSEEAATRIHDAQEFFAPRASTWNERFAEDAPAFERAIDDLQLVAGDAVLDVGCGAGRAFAPIRGAIGQLGMLVGVDVTIEMLHAARVEPGAAALATGDAAHVPFRAGCFDAIFAAGLVHHLADPVAGLTELARVARPGARLGVFQPLGRARLAAKHGHELRSDDPLDPLVLPALLTESGWTAVSIDDGPDRYLARAERTS